MMINTTYSFHKWYLPLVAYEAHIKVLREIGGLKAASSVGVIEAGGRQR
jgi:hypothetical protein